MRFPAPPAYSAQRVGIIAPVPPAAPALLGLSQTLEGFFLAEPRGLVSYRIRSWGSFAPQGIPLTWTPRGSSPSGTLSAFLPQSLSSHRSVSQAIRAAPPGLFIPRESVAAHGVFHPRSARDPHELFHHLCGIPSVRFGIPSAFCPEGSAATLLAVPKH